MRSVFFRIEEKKNNRTSVIGIFRGRQEVAQNLRLLLGLKFIVCFNVKNSCYINSSEVLLSRHYVSTGSKNRKTREPIVQISSLNKGKLPISGVIRCPFIVIRSEDKADN